MGGLGKGFIILWGIILIILVWKFEQHLGYKYVHEDKVEQAIKLEIDSFRRNEIKLLENRVMVLELLESINRAESNKQE
jgi:hypothetical protein